MPPRKPRRPRVDASDYDSEVVHDANRSRRPTVKPPLTTHVPARSNEELNLAVLQRHNPSIQQVLSVTGFACIYSFSAETQSWNKIGIEGTLFVCQLLPSYLQDAGEGSLVERYGVVVLNRKGLNNFYVELKSQADVDVEGEYVILQVGEDEEAEAGIYGLWIFCAAANGVERDVAAAVIMECAGRAERSRGLLAGDAEEEAYDQGYEEGYQEGYDEGARDQTEAYSRNGFHGHSQEVPAELPQSAAAGQSIDLLSLFGKANGPAHVPQQTLPQHQNGQLPEYQHIQGHGLPSGHPHAHPQMTPQQTQAANLLSLFRR